MNDEEYKDYLTNTIEHIYPDYLNRKMLKKLTKEGIVINDKRKSMPGQLNITSVDVSFIEKLNEKFISIMKSNESGKAVEVMETFEFHKQYRQCFYFSIDGEVNYDIIENDIDNKLKFDLQTNIENNSYVQPKTKIKNDRIYIKYNHFFDNIDSIKIKFVVLVIIHKISNIIEIRMDKIPVDFKRNNNIYANIVDETLNKLETKLDVKCIALDVSAIVQFIKQRKKDVKICAQKMMRNGSVAYLESSEKIVGEDTDLVIPILGELEELIYTHEELFCKDENTKSIRRILTEFINKIDINSDLPNVKLLWQDKNIKVGIYNSYKDKDYSLILYVDELEDKEDKMDYVREYIVSCYRELEKETQPDRISD